MKQNFLGGQGDAAESTDRDIHAQNQLDNTQPVTDGLGKSMPWIPVPAPVLTHLFSL